jgi:FlaA1/EpsC-like NDP-sugar epimerase
VTDDLDISSNLYPQYMVRHRTLIIVVLHAFAFAVALLAAFALAYNFRDFHRWLGALYVPMLAIALPLKLIAFHFTGMYRGSWRYVGLRDVFDVVSSSAIGSFVFLTTYFLFENFWRLRFGTLLIDPGAELILRQSVFPLDWAATVALVAGARIMVRFYYEEVRPGRVGEASRVLIVGAGDAGEALLRELLRMSRTQYHCVGLLDDDTQRVHQRIHGVEVVGTVGDLAKQCADRNVQEVMIALPSASPRTIRELIESCEGLGVLFRIVPPMSDVIAGRVQVSQVREVDIEDLLGREPVALDVDGIGMQLRGKRVVVTGAGGSIGSEMCRQIANFDPERLILVEQAENALFQIERELRARWPKVEAVPYVADIIDRERLQTIFRMEKPSTVFHAAAHKHVPMMECNPGEAVKNNIGGTMAVADTAVAAGVEKMVMISTDKAVNPTSVMGCSKRVAELYVQQLSDRTDTQFVTVRFGNVLGSSGSVVPIFREQIAKGGPVTVTHEDMTRYFMTIPEAAQLVLQAGVMGKGGEIYVLHMGEPVRIVDLARDMITLSGLRPNVDIEITFVGMRPGEKLYEELAHEGEHVSDTAHPKIGIWKRRSANWDELLQSISQLRSMADEATAVEIRAQLNRMVPEYKLPVEDVASTSAATAASSS